MGVSKATFSLWERGVHEPSLEHKPRIVEFLGYVPYDTCQTLGERIRLYRMSLGLTHVEFGQKLGVTHSTILRWENDRVKNVEKKIRPYLGGLIDIGYSDLP